MRPCTMARDLGTVDTLKDWLKENTPGKTVWDRILRDKVVG